MPPLPMHQPFNPAPIQTAPVGGEEDKFNSTSPHTQAGAVETGGDDLRRLRYPDELLNDVNVPSGRLQFAES